MDITRFNMKLFSTWEAHPPPPPPPPPPGCNFPGAGHLAANLKQGGITEFWPLSCCQTQANEHGITDCNVHDRSSLSTQRTWRPHLATHLRLPGHQQFAVVNIQNNNYTFSSLCLQDFFNAFKHFKTGIVACLPAIQKNGDSRICISSDHPVLFILTFLFPHYSLTGLILYTPSFTVSLNTVLKTLLSLQKLSRTKA